MKILNNNNENFKRLTRNERGLVGIGTLIVFIAVVIVAAVAAGVLINTSGTLQQQARATGQETITEVSSGAKVVAVKGYTDETGLVENLEVVVKPYPGTRGINLENMVIQFKSEENAYHLTYGGGEDADPGENFGIVRIQNVSGTQTGMLDQMGDIAKLVIQLNNKLSESEESSLMLIPSHGFESYYGLQVPHILKENRWYEL